MAAFSPVKTLSISCLAPLVASVLLVPSLVLLHSIHFDLVKSLPDDGRLPFIWVECDHFPKMYPCGEGILSLVEEQALITDSARRQHLVTSMPVAQNLTELWPDFDTYPIVEKQTFRFFCGERDTRSFVQTCRDWVSFFFYFRPLEATFATVLLAVLAGAFIRILSFGFTRYQV